MLILYHEREKREEGERGGGEQKGEEERGKGREGEREREGGRVKDMHCKNHGTADLH